MGSFETKCSTEINLREELESKFSRKTPLFCICRHSSETATNYAAFPLRRFLTPIPARTTVNSPDLRLNAVKYHKHTRNVPETKRSRKYLVFSHHEESKSHIHSIVFRQRVAPPSEHHLRESVGNQ